jgi:hypothetical protein
MYNDPEIKCRACGRPADDPHHYVTRGAGGTKTIPICREHHDLWESMGRDSFCLKFFKKSYKEMENIWDQQVEKEPEPKKTPDIDTLDLEYVKAHSDKLLWSSQQDYERIIKELAKARELHADQTLAYRRKKRLRLHELLGRMPESTARGIAENDCSEELSAVKQTEESIHIMTDFAEGTKERLQIIKMVIKVKYGDIQ